MNAPLVEMFRYNRWAMLELLEACRNLPDEPLDATVAGTSGSVRELLMHVVGGQQTFVLRTEGRQQPGELNRDSPWPGFDALIEIAAQTSDELIAIAGALEQDVAVDLPFMGSVYRFPRSFFLLHALEHGVEHRTEVKLALGHLGIETPDLDGWQWAATAGYGQEA